MKHVIFPVILAVTVPVWAAESQPLTKPAPQQPAAQVDSPLVAAAKRTGRLNKHPAFVITNETLAQMNSGHFSTTAQQADVTAPTKPIAPTPEMRAANDAASQAEARARVEAEQRRLYQQRMQRTAAAAAAYEENSFLSNDPAAAERALEMQRGAQPPTSYNNTAPPQSQGSQKPPQDQN